MFVYLVVMMAVCAGDIQLFDWLGQDGMDPVIASKFPPQAEAVLTCRMDPRVQGSSTGPCELGQRVAKLGYWWPRGLRRN